VLEGVDAHRLVGDDPLEARVLSFELLHPGEIADVEAAVFGLPVP